MTGGRNYAVRLRQQDRSKYEGGSVYTIISFTTVHIGLESETVDEIISLSNCQVFFFFTLFCFTSARKPSEKETPTEDVRTHKETPQDDLEAQGSVLSYRFLSLHALLIVLFNRCCGDLINECCRMRRAHSRLKSVIW